MRISDWSSDVCSSDLVLAVPAELFYRLADVVERSMGRGLAGHGFEGARIPAAGELLDGGDVDRAVVEVVLDLRQVAGEEAPVGADRVAAQGDRAGLWDVGLDELEGCATGLLERHRRRLDGSEELAGDRKSLMRLSYAVFR